MPELMGAGVALFDYDNDGDLDVFLVQGGPLEPAAKTGPRRRRAACSATISPVGADGRRTLRFTDVTERAGVGLRAYGMGAAVGDYDNDGDLDLFVTSFGPDTLYRNNGDGTFTDVTDAGRRQRRALEHQRAPSSTTTATAISISSSPTTSTSRSPPTSSATTRVGARDYCSPRAYRPVPDRLYRNEGNGRFTDATETAGISKADGAGLGVSTGDYNGDGWLDLYVANDATPNQLWINQPNGTFADEGLLSGSALNAAGNPEGSMGIASGDFDGDGDEDLFVTNIVGETFALYVNDGRGNFEDARAQGGARGADRGVHRLRHRLVRLRQRRLARSFVANGAVNVIEAQRGQPSPFRMRNQLFRNTGARRFEETSAAGRRRRSRAPESAAAPPSATSTTTATSTSWSRTTTARCGCCSIRRRDGAITGCRCACTQAPGQPLRVRRPGRRRARRTADALAPRQDRRQLPLRQRRARALRPRRVGRDRRRRRAVAGRRARALDRPGRRPADHAAPRHRETTVTGAFWNVVSGFSRTVITVHLKSV